VLLFRRKRWSTGPPSGVAVTGPLQATIDQREQAAERQHEGRVIRKLWHVTKLSAIAPMTGGIRIELSRCPFGAAQQALDRNSHQISGKRVDPTRAVANPIGSSTTGSFVVEKPPPPIDHTGFPPAGQGIAELRAVLGYKLPAPQVLRGRDDPNDRARCK